MGLSVLILMSIVFQAARAGTVCEVPGPTIPGSLHSLHGALSQGSLPPPLDQIGNDTPSYTAPERLMGFSYYVGSGNERFEKLEGYDDVYLYIDHYDPARHPLNRLFLGSSAIIKIDRTQTPARYVYLSREKHIGSKTGEELKDVKSVNEHLCSLNSACDRKLKSFNLQARTADFDTRIAPEYKASIRKRFSDLLLVDTYASEPGISSSVRAVLERLESEARGSPAEINAWLAKEMRKITESKIGKLTREQYQSKVKGKENERALEYITYQSLTTNVEIELEKRAHHSKKEAILSFCATRDSDECRTARALKSDLDQFQSRRQLLPKETGIPVY